LNWNAINNSFFGSKNSKEKEEEKNRFDKG